MTAERGFTSREALEIINGGCLCTLGRGPCALHAPPLPPVPCFPCAGSGEFPPTGGAVCPWCGGEGEVPAQYVVSYETRLPSEVPHCAGRQAAAHPAVPMLPAGDGWRCPVCGEIDPLP